MANEQGKINIRISKFSNGFRYHSNIFSLIKSFVTPGVRGSKCRLHWQKCNHNGVIFVQHFRPRAERYKV